MISANFTHDLGQLRQTSTPRHRHAAALVERNSTHLRIDGAHAGVGGIDSWGASPSTAFLIWQPPSLFGNHLPYLATTFLIWQVRRRCRSTSSTPAKRVHGGLRCARLRATTRRRTRSRRSFGVTSLMISHRSRRPPHRPSECCVTRAYYIYPPRIKKLYIYCHRYIPGKMPPAPGRGASPSNSRGMARVAVPSASAYTSRLRCVYRAYINHNTCQAVQQ